MRGLKAISAVVALSAAVSAVRAAPYVVYDLGTLGGAGTLSRGYGVSATGIVAGASTYDSSGLRNGMGADIGGGSPSRTQYAPIAGGNESFLMGVGGVSGGDVVGFTLATNRGTHAVLGSGGTLTDLHSQLTANGALSGSTTSRAFGINGNGDVVGHVKTNGGNMQAFYLSGGAATVLPLVGGYANSMATGVNDAGTAVGFGYNGSWVYAMTGSIANGATGAMAFAWSSGGGVTSLGTLGGSDSIATAVNAGGTIVGQSTVLPGDSLLNSGHAFAYSGGVMSRLNELAGATSSEAEGINASGVIVGTVLTPAGQKAFVYQNGAMADLNDPVAYPGWTFLEADSINDDGYITGYGRHNGQTVAFLLQPTGTLAPSAPEPASAALLGVGAMVVAGRRRR